MCDGMDCGDCGDCACECCASKDCNCCDSNCCNGDCCLGNCGGDNCCANGEWCCGCGLDCCFQRCTDMMRGVVSCAAGTVCEACCDALVTDCTCCDEARSDNRSRRRRNRRKENEQEIIDFDDVNDEDLPSIIIQTQPLSNTDGAKQEFSTNYHHHNGGSLPITREADIPTHIKEAAAESDTFPLKSDSQVLSGGTVLIMKEADIPSHYQGAIGKSDEFAHVSDPHDPHDPNGEAVPITGDADIPIHIKEAECPPPPSYEDAVAIEETVV